MNKEIRCPYCSPDKTEYVDMVDRFINSFYCDECDETMDYQKLWFNLKEELIGLKNKGDMQINDLVEKMDRAEIVEFKFSKLSKSTLVCEEDVKKWLGLNNAYKCNICGGELYYTGNNALVLPPKKEYKCKVCRNVITK